MKLKTILTLCLFVLMSGAYAQKNFEGKIIYDLTFPSMDLDPQMMAMLPKETTMYIKDNKSRVEMSTAMGKNITISDAKAKTSIALMDVMGQKIAIKMSEKEMKELDKSKVEPQVKLLDETKDIAGYKCKKAEIIMIGEDTLRTFVYYTSDLKSSANFNWSQKQFKGIDGFLMEYEINQQGMNMKMVAREIVAEPVLDKSFTIPTGYKEMTPAEIQKAFSGGK